MAVTEEGLHQVITADASGVTPAYEQAINIITQLTGAQTKAAVSTKGHAEAETILGASIGKVEVATNAAARAFSALGLETGTATARVTAMTEAFDALGSAAPSLLILGTALLGVGAAVGFVKEAIGEAAAMQTNLNTLGVAIRNQGTDWNAARDGVERWAASLESATIYSRHEAIDALNGLVTAGVHVSDAEKMIGIATDVASGSGRTLVEVSDAMKAATLGRGIALERLDINLKKVVSTHGKLSEALTILSHDFSRQAAAATDTYEGKQKQLHNTIAALAEMIGMKMIPALTDLASVTMGVIKGLEEHWDKATYAASKYGRALSDILTITSGSAQLSDKLRAGFDIAHLFDDSYKPPKGVFENWWDGLVESGREAGKKARAAWEAEQRAKGTSLDNDITLGKGGPKSAKAPPTLIEASETARTDQVVMAQAKLKESLASLTESEVSYKNAVSLSTTEQGKARAELALKTKVVSDAKIATSELNAQIVAQTSDMEFLGALQLKEKQTMDDAAISYNRAAQAKGEDSAAVKMLKRDYDEAKKSYDDTIKTLATLTTERDANNKQLSVEAAKLIEVAAAQAALSLAQNKALIAAQKKNEENLRHYADEENTYKKSITQQISYYDQRLETIKSSGKDEYNETDALQKKIMELEDQAYKDRVDNAASSLLLIQEKEKGMLDDLLTKHKTARDELKTVWDDIKNSYIQMVEQMVLKSALFETILPGIFGQAGSGTLGGKKVAKETGGGIGNLFNPFSSSGATDGSSGPVGTKEDPIFVEGTNAHFSALTGSSTGLRAGSSDGSSIPIAIASAGSAVVGSSGNAALAAGLSFGLAASGASGGNVSSGTPTVNSIFSALGLGGSGSSTGISGAGGSWQGGSGTSTATGATSNDLTVMGPNGPITNSASASYTSGASTASRVAGGLGGAAMTAAGYKQGGLSGGLEAGLGTYEMENAINPVFANSPVGLGIAAASGLVAGLTHHDNPANMPDKYNTQIYGQSIADVGAKSGTFQANGQNFSESYGMSQQLGGATELQAISAYIAKTGGSGLTPQQIADLKGVTSLDTSSLKNGNLTSNTGEVKNWNDWVTEVNAALGVVEQLGGAPAFTMSRTYPNMQPVLSGGNLAPPGPGGATGGFRRTAGVYVDLTGATIVGPEGLDSVAVTIGQALQHAATGQTAGAGSSQTLTNNPGPGTSRFRGDF